MYPKKIENLIEMFQMLNGVGKKTAERYAIEIMKMDKENVLEFSKAIDDVKDVKKCRICGNFCDDDICDVCNNLNRDHSVIMVVSEASSIINFEKNGNYNGVYHVLNGEISPSKGVMPEDLKIDELLCRIEKDNIKEVILGTNLTVDGETTAMYISKKIMSINDNVNVSRIANGIPIGGHVDYADELTLSKAIEGRKKYNN